MEDQFDHEEHGTLGLGTDNGRCGGGRKCTSVQDTQGVN